MANIAGGYQAYGAAVEGPEAQATMQAQQIQNQSNQMQLDEQQNYMKSFRAVTQAIHGQGQTAQTDDTEKSALGANAPGAAKGDVEAGGLSGTGPGADAANTAQLQQGQATALQRQGQDTPPAPTTPDQQNMQQAAAVIPTVEAQNAADAQRQQGLLSQQQQAHPGAYVPGHMQQGVTPQQAQDQPQTALSGSTPQSAGPSGEQTVQPGTDLTGTPSALGSSTPPGLQPLPQASSAPAPAPSSPNKPTLGNLSQNSAQAVSQRVDLPKVLADQKIPMSPAAVKGAQAAFQAHEDATKQAMTQNVQDMVRSNVGLSEPEQMKNVAEYLKSHGLAGAPDGFQPEVQDGKTVGWMSTHKDGTPGSMIPNTSGDFLGSMSNVLYHGIDPTGQMALKAQYQHEIEKASAARTVWGQTAKDIQGMKGEQNMVQTKEKDEAAQKRAETRAKAQTDVQGLKNSKGSGSGAKDSSLDKATAAEAETYNSQAKSLETAAGKSLDPKEAANLRAQAKVLRQKAVDTIKKNPSATQGTAQPAPQVPSPAGGSVPYTAFK